MGKIQGNGTNENRPAWPDSAREVLPERKSRQRGRNEGRREAGEGARIQMGLSLARPAPSDCITKRPSPRRESRLCVDFRRPRSLHLKKRDTASCLSDSCTDCSRGSSDPLEQSGVGRARSDAREKKTAHIGRGRVREPPAHPPFCEHRRTWGAAQPPTRRGGQDPFPWVGGHVTFYEVQVMSSCSWLPISVSARCGMTSFRSPEIRGEGLGSDISGVDGEDFRC